MNGVVFGRASVVFAFFWDIPRIMFRFSTFFHFEVVRLCLQPLVSLYDYCNNNIVDFEFVVFTKYLCGKIILVYPLLAGSAEQVLW